MIRLKKLLKETQLNEVVFDRYVEGVLKALEKLDKRVYQRVVSMFDRDDKYEKYISKAYSSHIDPQQVAQDLLNMISPRRYGMSESTEYNEKDEIVQQLIKWGNNKDESIKMTNKHYAYIHRNYPKASIKTKAEIIRAIY